MSEESHVQIIHIHNECVKPNWSLVYHILKSFSDVKKVGLDPNSQHVFTTRPTHAGIIPVSSDVRDCIGIPFFKDGKYSDVKIVLLTAPKQQACIQWVVEELLVSRSNVSRISFILMSCERAICYVAFETTMSVCISGEYLSMHFYDTIHLRGLSIEAFVVWRPIQ